MMCTLSFYFQVAMVEVEVSEATPPGLLIPFAMHTAILIFIHLFSLVLASRLLPELDAMSAHPHLGFSGTLARGWYVQLCWVLSNILGVILFLVELVLVAYVKFFPSNSSENDKLHVGTGTLAVVVVLSILVLPFVVIFFRSISKQKIQLHEQRLAKARQLLENINQAAPTSEQNLDSHSITSYHTSGSYEYTFRQGINTEV